MKHTPTAEQLAILEAIADQTDPVIVAEAGPGCAKTSTIIMAIQVLAPQYKPQWKPQHCKLTYTAFNKDIVVETRNKLIEADINKSATGLSIVDCVTFNSLGLRVWSKLLTPGQRVEPRLSKNTEMLKWVQDQGRYSIAPEEWDDYKTLMRFAKSQGYLPRGSGSAFVSLLTFEALCEVADIRPAPHYRAVLDEALNRSIKVSYDRIMDFDDQLYMSAFFGSFGAGPDWLFVDEVQDCSPVQLHLINRIKPKFLVLVGDPKQAIYAFRGAMTDSFARIFDYWPKARKMPLQSSFRIPQNVLPLLSAHNPALRTVARTSGDVEHISGAGSIRAICAGAVGTKAILCRNNAPLYRTALACMAANVPFTMSDSRFGEGLIRDITRAHEGNLQGWPVDPQFFARMARWWAERSDPDNKRATEIIFDKVFSLHALADITNPSNVAALCLTIKSLLAKGNNSEAKGRSLFLSTAHKAKGLEFDWVLHLDPHLIPSPTAETPEELTQEANIAYVINSRTRNVLKFATSEQITIPGAPPPRRRPTTKGHQPL